MTAQLHPICPECGDEVSEAGDLCANCLAAESEFWDGDEDEICPECHDVNCDGDCYDEADDFEYDDEIKDHVVNSRGDIA